MGLLADSVGKVLNAIGHGVRVYAVRDSTAGGATDARWNPLRVGATGGLIIEATNIAATVGQQLPSSSMSIVGCTTQRTATGPITATTNGVLLAAAGRLHAIDVHFEGSGTKYITLHDAATTGTIAAGTLIRWGYKVTTSTREILVEFFEPLPFVTGIAWAISSTQTTFTADADTAHVFGHWEAAI